MRKSIRSKKRNRERYGKTIRVSHFKTNIKFLKYKKIKTMKVNLLPYVKIKKLNNTLKNTA